MTLPAYGERSPMTLSSPLNLAVVGLGRMGKLYAQTVATRVSGASLYAVADPNPAAVAAIRDQHHVPVTATDARDLFTRPDIHAILIATPTSTHADLVIAAAQAGKAIFSEKPLALTIPETRAAIAAVERAGVPLQVGFNRRYDAAYLKAKAFIDEGRIGRPVTVKSVGRDPFCPRAEFADPAKSGGLIIDMGIHDFDVSRWLMGSEVERVSAEGTLAVCDTLAAVGDIDNALVNLRFANGGLGNVEVSRHAFYGYDIRTEILGSAGGINIGGYQHLPVLLLTRDGAQHDVLPYLMERFGPAYQAQIQAFVDGVREDKPVSPGGADALAALEIGVAATLSAREGRPVALAELR